MDAKVENSTHYYFKLNHITAEKQYFRNYIVSLNFWIQVIEIFKKQT